MDRSLKRVFNQDVILRKKVCDFALLVLEQIEYCVWITIPLYSNMNNKSTITLLS